MSSEFSPKQIEAIRQLIREEMAAVATTAADETAKSAAHVELYMDQDAMLQARVIDPGTGLVLSDTGGDAA